jgi:hypothetical protein
MRKKVEPLFPQSTLLIQTVSDWHSCLGVRRASPVGFGVGDGVAIEDGALARRCYRKGIRSFFAASHRHDLIGGDAWQTGAPSRFEPRLEFLRLESPFRLCFHPSAEEGVKLCLLRRRQLSHGGFECGTRTRNSVETAGQKVSESP